MMDVQVLIQELDSAFVADAELMERTKAIVAAAREIAEVAGSMVAALENKHTGYFNEGMEKLETLIYADDHSPREVFMALQARRTDHYRATRAVKRILVPKEDENGEEEW